MDMGIDIQISVSKSMALDKIPYYLQGYFPDTFKVWHDSLGSDVIGLTWRRTSKVKLCLPDFSQCQFNSCQSLKDNPPIMLVSETGTGRGGWGS